MRMRSTTAALLTLVLATALFAHHGPATIKIAAAAKKQPAVTFSHEKHTNWVGCELCHPEVFPLTQRGSAKFDMAKIRAGQYCGACHNTVAFPLVECRRCHAEEAQQRRMAR